MSHPDAPDTPRRPLLASITLEENGNGHDHRSEPHTERLERRDLETQERFGHIARELSALKLADAKLEASAARLEANDSTIIVEVRRIAARLAITEADRATPRHGTPLPPMRPPADSYSDLDDEQTLGGTRVLRLTPEQLDARLDARVAFVRQQEELARDAAPKRFLVGKALPAAVLAACGAIVTTAIAWIVGKLTSHQ